MNTCCEMRVEKGATRARRGMPAREQRQVFQLATMGSAWRIPIPSTSFISHKVHSKSFCKGRFPHNLVNIFLILARVKDKSTNLLGS